MLFRTLRETLSLSFSLFIEKRNPENVGISHERVLAAISCAENFVITRYFCEENCCCLNLTHVLCSHPKLVREENSCNMRELRLIIIKGGEAKTRGFSTVNIYPSE